LAGTSAAAFVTHALTSANPACAAFAASPPPAELEAIAFFVMMNVTLLPSVPI
jgi:hypothetical protein